MALEVFLPVDADFLPAVLFGEEVPLALEAFAAEAFLAVVLAPVGLGFFAGVAANPASPVANARTKAIAFKRKV